MVKACVTIGCNPSFSRDCPPNIYRIPAGRNYFSTPEGRKRIIHSKHLFLSAQGDATELGSIKDIAKLKCSHLQTLLTFSAYLFGLVPCQASESAIMQHLHGIYSK